MYIKILPNKELYDNEYKNKGIVAGKVYEAEAGSANGAYVGKYHLLDCQFKIIQPNIYLEIDRINQAANNRH